MRGRVLVFLRSLSVLLTIAVFGALSGCQSPSTPAAPTNASPSTKLDALPTALRDLSADEAQGGHTLSKHVGKSDEDLRQRLTREHNISAASTYTDRDTAQKVVGTVLDQQREKIQRWLERSGEHSNLALDYRGEHPIGRTLRRGSSSAQPCSQALVVLRYAGGGQYYVLTSYPECR
jgi:CDI toxin RNase A-like protein